LCAPSPAPSNPCTRLYLLQLFDFLKAVGAKAMHDTQMVAKAIQEKAAHDIQTMQDQQKAKQAEPATHPAT
jgi:hypothetical protein